jgi:hypothetical protein
VEELGLQAQRHLADLVEQDRALLGLLELARLLAIGPRERAALMPEELGLQQLARQGGAVDLQQRVRGARRRAMNGARHDFLADAALARQQHRGARGGDLRDEIAHGPHRRSGAEVQLVHGGLRPFDVGCLHRRAKCTVRAKWGSSVRPLFHGITRSAAGLYSREVVLTRYMQ